MSAFTVVIVFRIVFVYRFSLFDVLFDAIYKSQFVRYFWHVNRLALAVIVFTASARACRRGWFRLVARLF